MLNFNHPSRALSETADLHETHCIAVFRKFYTLRKEVNELQASVDKLYDYVVKNLGGHL